MPTIVPRRRAIRRVAEMPLSVTIQPMHRVAVLALDAVVPLDLAIPAQVFGTYDEAPYRVTVCAAAPGPVTTSAGFDVVAQAGPEALATRRHGPRAGLQRRTCAVPPAPVLDALQAAHARGARMVSICTGAFALAAAGILDGRRATTHWRDAAELAARYPRIDVEPGVLYIDEGDVLTQRRRRRRPRPLPAHPAPRPRRRAGQHDRAPDRRPAPPRGRPGAVHRPAGPRPRGRLARRHPRVGARAPARAAHRPRPRRPRPRLRAHLRPPLQRRDRRPGPALAARPARRRRPRRPRGHRREHRRDRPPLRLRHRREPAQALPPRRLDHPDGLPPSLRRNRNAT